jgi:hypothetical protein
LVAVDAEKLTMTSRRPPRQETQSTAAFLKPSKPFKPSGATAASDEVMGGLGIEPPTCLQDNFWDSYKTAQHSFGSFVSVFSSVFGRKALKIKRVWDFTKVYRHKCRRHCVDFCLKNALELTCMDL